MKHKAVFLDVNDFLHFEDLDGIDWETELGTTSLSFHIAPSVLQELEDKRRDYGQSQKIRKRARSKAKKLTDRLEDGGLVGEKYTISLVDFRLKVDYEKFDLDKAVADDRLLSCALAYKEASPEQEVVVVTDDSILRAKCKHYALLCHRLSEQYELADEPDPLEKENQELKKQILELQSSQPKLFAEFENGKHILEPQIGVDKFDYEKALERLHEKLPGYMDEAVAKAFGQSPFITKFYNSKVPSAAARQKYFLECDEHIQSLRELNEAQLYIASLQIKVVNDGTMPGEGCRIDIELPDNVEFVKERPMPLSEPTVPPPEGSFGAVYPGYSMPWMDHVAVRKADLLLNSWIYTSKREAVFQPQKPLLHTMCIMLPELRVRWVDDHVTNFEFDVHILASNLRKPVVQKLSVQPITLD